MQTFNYFQRATDFALNLRAGSRSKPETEQKLNTKIIVDEITFAEQSLEMAMRDAGYAKKSSQFSSPRPNY